MTFATHTTDSVDTQNLGHKLGTLLHGGEVIELISDLGGGKTTLTQGIARGLGYMDPVTSPTFTLNQIYYLSSGIEIHHYDFYRLTEAGILDFEIGEDIASPKVITIIEWGEIVGDILPADRLQVFLTMNSENTREIKFIGSSLRVKEIIEGLAK